MMKFRALSVFLAAVLLLPASVMASEYYPAFLVLRYFVDGSEQERERLKGDFREYYLSHGREAASFQILNEHGQSIGRGSWMAFESQETAQEFIENDPYQQAKLYRDVSVDEANIYFLDQWFSIAPSWQHDAALEKAHDRYDDLISSKPVTPR
ncbi:MAG: hypothetical protein ACI87W_003359 [Halieaceae bacterium]|jgi:hypothetical protein